MEAMVAQSFISEERQTPLSLEKIREADKQSSKLIVGFPVRTSDETLSGSRAPEDLPRAQYKLDMFDNAPYFKSPERNEIREVLNGKEGDIANNGSASDEPGTEDTKKRTNRRTNT